MWQNSNLGAGNPIGIGFWGTGVAIGLAVVLLWSIVWKGLALWKAAREGSKPWFIALLIVNTAGILEILYLFVFSKKSASAEHMGERKM